MAGGFARDADSARRRRPFARSRGPVLLSIYQLGSARRLLVRQHHRPRLPDHRSADQSQGDGSFNVAFFPAYPALASLLRAALRVDTETALLIAAQLAAWGFWTYFFLFCKRWNLSPTIRVFGAFS